MKRFIIICATTVLLAFNALAQVRTVTVYSGTATGINATTTNSPGTVFATEDARQVSALLSYSLPAGTNGPVSVEFVRSPDGSNYESTPFVTLTLTSSGTAAGYALTNFDVGAASKLKLSRVVNLNTNHATNLLLVLSIKPERK